MSREFSTEDDTKPEAHKTLAEVAREWREAQVADIATSERPTRNIRTPRRAP